MKESPTLAACARMQALQVKVAGSARVQPEPSVKLAYATEFQAGRLRFMSAATHAAGSTS
jgi:hypothetical protein